MQKLKVVLLEPDLFFSMRIVDTLQKLGQEPVVARDLAHLESLLAEHTPAYTIIDIGSSRVKWDDAIKLSRQKNIPVLAFGSHVDMESQQVARETGATRVISNSKLNSSLGLIAQQLAGKSQKVLAAIEQVEIEE